MAAASPTRPGAALTRPRDNAILLFTGLSPSAHAASSAADPTPGWWEPVLGPGQAIDTDRWFVVCVNSLGSCFGSSGPAAATTRHRPALRTRLPRASPSKTSPQPATRWSQSLGLKSLAAVVGASLGGMASLAFAALFPGFARNADQRLGQRRCIAIRDRAALGAARSRLSVTTDLAAGRYARGRNPRNGMRLARKIGTITYRSAVEWQQRYGRLPKSAQSADLTISSASSRWSRTSKVRQSVLPTLSTPIATCICRAPWIGLTSRGMGASTGGAEIRSGVDADHWRRDGHAVSHRGTRPGRPGLCQRRRRTQLVRVESPAGHDAFLADTPPFEAAIRAFLTEFTLVGAAITVVEPRACEKRFRPYLARCFVN